MFICSKEIPEEFEKSFYKTLACLKNKDPRIYNENVKFFEEADKKSVENETRSKEKKEKSLFLRDYERKMIVERGGKFSDSENEDEEKHDEHRNPTYVQEQQELRESFKNVLQDDDTQEDLLFKPKPRSKEAIRKVSEFCDSRPSLLALQHHIEMKFQKHPFIHLFSILNTNYETEGIKISCNFIILITCRKKKITRNG